MGGDMNGKSPMVEDYEKLGGEDCMEGLDIFLVLRSSILEIG
jgi:hypothetical protein